MDLSDLINMLFASTYHDNDGDHNILYWQAERDAVRNVVYTWGAKQETFTTTAKKIAELEAKVYAYEAIIANSNFAPMLKANTAESGADY